MKFGVLRAGSWNIFWKVLLSLWANIPDVSEYHSAFIFMIKQSKNNGMLDPRDENTKVLRSAADYLPNEKSHVSVDINFRM
jgi:hypothetical protein